MDFELIKRAYNFAKLKHSGQTRDNGEDYLSHPVSVAKLVIKHKPSHNLDILVAGALLHDTLEDTYTSYRELIDNFGIVIASLVMELTTAGFVPKLEGKEVYLSKKMQNMSNYALAIKLADRLDNVSDLKTTTKEKRERVIFQTKYILGYLKQNRELTDCQNHLIELIEKEIENYEIGEN